MFCIPFILPIVAITTMLIIKAHKALAGSATCGTASAAFKAYLTK